MMNKRDFLKASSLIGLNSFLSFSALGRMLDQAANLPVDELAKDDEFWTAVRGEYNLKKEYINLESGYYNIMPLPIQERYLQHIRDVNKLGAFYMRTMQAGNKKRVTSKLAQLAGCSSEELIITRNTTESLDMIIAGLDWKRGDEAIMAEQDYGAMLNMFRQVSERYGVVNKVLSVPQHPENDDEIVSLYEKAITKKTRLLMICHMINITGHILPVQKICDMAHKHGVLVMVDGAHTFAHLDFKVPDLHADFYGCSLHKWLSVPLGAGMLYVKKEHIKKIWPLLAEDKSQDDNILRLNHTGTHPVATDLTIEDAIDFYNNLGPQKKEARLRYLQRYWTEQVRDIPNVILHTPADPKRACAIANVGIKAISPADMAKRLFDDYKIYTVAINNAGVHGCRITPNIFTTKDELDVLVEAIKAMAV
ncbi:MAG: aminotransferase class V-fold PLP-dependent enzyme [Chitinophagaceae bacterium]|nr:aminotransferase class V-fold PLP-dependent enzyme [Chitinophagaceae bacterium]